jgi:hypothetical protein
MAEVLPLSAPVVGGVVAEWVLSAGPTVEWMAERQIQPPYLSLPRIQEK